MKESLGKTAFPKLNSSGKDFSKMREITTEDLANVKKMQEKIEKKLYGMEYRAVTFLGIKNVSRSDLETVAEVYLPCFENFEFYKFSEPCGNKAKILEKFNLNVWKD